MPSFNFAPTNDVPRGVLEGRSTTAKLRVQPIDAYVDAKIAPPTTASGIWTASVESIPMSPTIPREQHQAQLYFSKGELGKHLGMIDLGSL